ncbi:MAG: hypothetical protein ACTIMA_05855, partial [Brachybacterium tyrofermentans]
MPGSADDAEGGDVVEVDIESEIDVESEFDAEVDVLPAIVRRAVRPRAPVEGWSTRRRPMRVRTR